MKKRLSKDAFSNLLFGEVNEEKVMGFLEGSLADQYAAAGTLGELTHPELQGAYRSLSRNLKGQASHAIYVGNPTVYQSNGHASSYSRALLFQPELRELVLEPFTGLVEAANPGFKYEQGPGDLRLAFRNTHVRDNDRARPHSTGTRRI